MSRSPLRPCRDGSSVSPSHLQEPRRHARHSRPIRAAGPPAGNRCGRNGSDGLADALDPRGCARPRCHLRRRRESHRRGGQYLDVAEGGVAQHADAAAAERSAARRAVPRLFQPARSAGRPESPAWPAPRQFARLRLHHRCGGHRGHQQPRHLRGRRDHRHPQRRHAAEGRIDRQGSEDRHRAAAGEERQAAQGREVRRFREAQAGRMGDRHRQPVQSRRHRDGRHRLGAQPRHQFGPLRQLHSDRRVHQPRQFRRPAVQPRR